MIWLALYRWQHKNTNINTFHFQIKRNHMIYWWLLDLTFFTNLYDKTQNGPLLDDDTILLHDIKRRNSIIYFKGSPFRMIQIWSFMHDTNLTFFKWYKNWSFLHDKTILIFKRMLYQHERAKISFFLEVTVVFTLIPYHKINSL